MVLAVRVLDFQAKLFTPVRLAALVVVQHVTARLATAQLDKALQAAQPQVLMAVLVVAVPIKRVLTQHPQAVRAATAQAQT